MKLTRRSILGGLAAVPIAAPAIAEEVVTKAGKSGPWNPSMVPFTKQVMDHAADAVGYTENLYSIRQNALKAYVLATGTLPDWYLDELKEEHENFGHAQHNDIDALKSVSTAGRMMIFRRKMREHTIKRAIDRIAYMEDRRSRIASMAAAFYKGIGAK